MAELWIMLLYRGTKKGVGQEGEAALLQGLQADQNGGGDPSD
jgi:hypothetical protein